MIRDHRCTIPAGVVAFDSRKRVAICLAYCPWFGAVTNWTRTLAFALNGLATVSNENREKNQYISKIRLKKMKMKFQWKAFDSERTR